MVDEVKILCASKVGQVKEDQRSLLETQKASRRETRTAGEVQGGCKGGLDKQKKWLLYQISIEKGKERDQRPWIYLRREIAQGLF